MKKITKSKDDVILEGICGGIGEYLNIDPLWVRLAFIFMPYTVIMYLILMLIMRDSDND